MTCKVVTRGKVVLLLLFAYYDIHIFIVASYWYLDYDEDNYYKYYYLDDLSNSSTCDYLEFTCPNGERISKGWICDGELDCEDPADEKNCTERKLPAQVSLNYNSYN